MRLGVLYESFQDLISSVSIDPLPMSNPADLRFLYRKNVEPIAEQGPLNSCLILMQHCP
jgi:hypothetical protein